MEQVLNCTQRPARHGYTQWTGHQPGSRFQRVEGGWLLAVSILLLATVIWQARHRAT